MLELEQSARRAAGGAETKLLIALPRPLRPGSDVIVHGSLLGSRVSATLLSTQDTGSLRVELTDALDDVTNPAAVFEAAHRGPGGRLLAMEQGSWAGIGRRAHGVESAGHSLQQVQVSQCGFSLRFGIGETCYEICIRSDASVNESQLARFLHRHTFKNFTRLLLSGAADFREIECRDEDAISVSSSLATFVTSDRGWEEIVVRFKPSRANRKAHRVYMPDDYNG
uniref:Rad60-SLD domain-containing protein n=1 Tax=Macrostomum lignano TaxID=282301 RepID=A0A1I8JEH8_9PLAT